MLQNNVYSSDYHLPYDLAIVSFLVLKLWKFCWMFADFIYKVSVFCVLFIIWMLHIDGSVHDISNLVH